MLYVALENGYMKDNMSYEIYPTRLKRFYKNDKFWHKHKKNKQKK
ncbi:hypothetical protein [Campylobacter portucalensis]|nr:hypothetical protein [Campylobacter portucalensis]